MTQLKCVCNTRYSLPKIPLQIQSHLFFQAVCECKHARARMREISLTLFCSLFDSRLSFSNLRISIPYNLSLPLLMFQPFGNFMQLRVSIHTFDKNRTHTLRLFSIIENYLKVKKARSRYQHKKCLEKQHQHK